ncbi:MAG: DNA mismatch repair protein MutS, partial [Eubacterium sp.]
MALSPMMQQYLDIHKQYPDCILFFRLGDFYEMFFDDAKLVSRLLELTLTGKRCGLPERAPMCGVPFHAADSYTARLVEMGYKVAICEQLEDPAKTKGMVKRGVIRVVTPGTVTSEQILKDDENNYLACVYMDSQGMSVAYCDISTGELAVTEQIGKFGLYEDLLNELVRISPREILANKELLKEHDPKEAEHLTGAFISPYPEEISLSAAEETIRAQFGDGSLTALGLNDRTHCILAVGTLLSYLIETQKQGLKQITDCRFYEIGGRMSLDKATIRNLEITETLYDKRTAGSLLGILNKTGTAMGARMLKHWLREPLNDTERINSRLDAVQEIADHPVMMGDIRESLKHVYDFERLTGRIASGNANGKDMIALKNSIGALPQIKAALADAESALLNELKDSMADLGGIHDKIEQAIVEDPPAVIKEGGLIRRGYSEQLDQMKDSIKDAKAWIAGLEGREKERTGITHLKVGYNKVFGYYIEVSRSNLDQVPEDYIRKQTLVGAERFIIPELKEQEGVVLNAEGRINDLEYTLFTDLRH